jgi:hypothetical protein
MQTLSDIVGILPENTPPQGLGDSLYSGILPESTGEDEGFGDALLLLLQGVVLPKPVALPELTGDMNSDPDVWPEQSGLPSPNRVILPERWTHVNLNQDILLEQPGSPNSNVVIPPELLSRLTPNPDLLPEQIDSQNSNLAVQPELTSRLNPDLIIQAGGTSSLEPEPDVLPEQSGSLSTRAGVLPEQLGSPDRNPDILPEQPNLPNPSADVLSRQPNLPNPNSDVLLEEADSLNPDPEILPGQPDTPNLNPSILPEHLSSLKVKPDILPGQPGLLNPNPGVPSEPTGQLALAGSMPGLITLAEADSPGRAASSTPSMPSTTSMASMDRTAAPAQVPLTETARADKPRLAPEQEALKRSLDLFERDSRPKVTIIEGKGTAAVAKATLQEAPKSTHDPDSALPDIGKATHFSQAKPIMEAAPPTTPNPPEVVEQPAQERFTIETPKPYRIPGQIRVSLHPPELGHVRIDLAATRSGIIGSLRFQSQHSRRVVESEIGQLHKTLHDAGIRVERLQVTGTSFGDSRGSVHADADSTPQWSHDAPRERPQGQPRPDHPAMPDRPAVEHNAAFIGNPATFATSPAYASSGSVDLMA